jgi:hypothetical protein
MQSDRAVKPAVYLKLTFIFQKVLPLHTNETLAAKNSTRVTPQERKDELGAGGLGRDEEMCFLALAPSPLSRQQNSKRGLPALAFYIKCSS